VKLVARAKISAYVRTFQSFWILAEAADDIIGLDITRSINGDGG
jgi:hypothetical protein